MPRLRVVPAEVRDALGLQKGERLLAAAPDAEGAYVVASTLALYLPEPGGSGRSAWKRFGWEEIDHAEWERDAGRLRATPVVPFGEPIEQHTVAMPEPPETSQREVDRLLTVIRERVTASVVLDRRVPIDGDLGVRVVARRRPAPGAQLTWTVELDPGLDASDRAVLDAANAALDRVRAELSP